MRAAIIVIALGIVWGCSGEEPTPVTPDTTAPRVTATSPVDGAVDVPVDAPISATFSEEMDRWSLNAATVAVSGGVTGSIEYADRIVTLTPSSDLLFNQAYTVTITTDATDLAGNTLDSAHVWSFTTAPGDIMPLAIGNRWRFEVITYDTLLNPVDTTYDTIQIVRDTVIDDDTWYIDNKGDVRALRGGGLWKLASGNQPVLFLKYPAVKGDIYTSDQALSETIEVKEVSVLVATVLGDLHFCYRYNITFSDPTVRYSCYYAPAIGPVRIDRYWVGASARLVERRTLIRASLQ